LGRAANRTADCASDCLDLDIPAPGIDLLIDKLTEIRAELAQRIADDEAAG
jgi:hypothetical protein